MSIAAKTDAAGAARRGHGRVDHVSSIRDGRVVSTPLSWSWRLTDASPAQRENYEIIGDGQGVHWPDIDEDLSVEGMFRGVPARRPK
jgi:hypothetical protein